MGTLSSTAGSGRKAQEPVSWANAESFLQRLLRVFTLLLRSPSAFLSFPDLEHRSGAVHLQQAHPHLPPSSCRSQKSLRAVPVTLSPSHMASESFPPSAPATSEQPEKLFFRMEHTIHAE